MIRLAFLLLLLPVWAFAQEDPAVQAREAIGRLDAAVQKLDAAASARDRVRALTDTVSALEEGLSALRISLRQAAVREAELSAGLSERDQETAALITVLMQMGDTRRPLSLLHPGGAVGSARAGMLLAEVIPALNDKAAILRDDLDRLNDLRTVQAGAAEELQAGLRAVQTARMELNQAIAERQDLPKRFTNDPVREAILIASAETLADFAAGLERVAVDQIASAPAELDGKKGSLSLPVNGEVVRRAGEADAAGIARPGVILATAPRAILISPSAATIRYVGPLLDLGQVLILEPQAGVLFVLAGLDTVYGSAGDVVAAGSPLGLMGGDDHKFASEPSTVGDGTGAEPAERLYIEVRRNNTPEDPGLWFRMDKDG